MRLLFDISRPAWHISAFKCLGGYSQAEVGAHGPMSMLQVVQARVFISASVLSITWHSAGTRSLLNFPAHANPNSFYFFLPISKSFSMLLLFLSGSLPSPLRFDNSSWKIKKWQPSKRETQLCAGHNIWQLIIKWKRGSVKRYSQHSQFSPAK